MLPFRRRWSARQLAAAWSLLAGAGHVGGAERTAAARQQPARLSLPGIDLDFTLTALKACDTTLPKARDAWQAVAREARIWQNLK